MDANSPGMDYLSEIGKQIDELEKILGKYPASAENQSLLTLHVYELLKGYRKYVDYFEALFRLPTDREQELDQLLDILIGIEVLLEDMEYHSAELRAQIDKFADAAEPDP